MHVTPQGGAEASALLASI